MSLLREPIRILGFEFAPVLQPLQGRLQTLAAALALHIFYVGGFGCLFAAILLLFTRFYWLVLLYSLWVFYDRETPEKGGRPSPWIRNWPLWKYTAGYFPVQLHKTVDLPPDRNYIFCYHPHGVPAIGAYLNFSTEATGFSTQFRGLQASQVVLHGNFQFPFYRELALLSGLVSASRRSLQYMLDTSNGVGRVATLIVGGAREVLYAQPGQYTLVLRSRKGFARLALMYGSSLVPVFSFGEVDIYRSFAKNPEGSLLRRLQNWTLRVTGLPPPTVHGRGVINRTFGTVPFAKPLNVVVGAPIHVQRVEQPSGEQIDQLHALYIQKLTDLFDTHKQAYGLQNAKLNIV